MLAKARAKLRAGHISSVIADCVGTLPLRSGGDSPKSAARVSKSRSWAEHPAMLYRFLSLAGIAAAADQPELVARPSFFSTPS
jgi:hypothetical protein